MKSIISSIILIFSINSFGSPLSINVSSNQLYILPGEAHSCEDQELIAKDPNYVGYSIKDYRVSIADLELNWVERNRHFKAERLVFSINNNGITHSQAVTGRELDYILGTKNGLVTSVTKSSSSSSTRPFNYLPCHPAFGGIAITDDKGLIEAYGYLTLEGQSFDPDGSHVINESYRRRVLLTFDF